MITSVVVPFRGYLTFESSPFSFLLFLKLVHTMSYFLRGKAGALPVFSTKRENDRNRVELRMEDFFFFHQHQKDAMMFSCAMVTVW